MQKLHTHLRIIKMVWLSKIWDWLKKNWKYVVTFGIPVVLSMIMSLIRSNQSLEKKVKLKENEKDIENKARDLQEEMLQEEDDYSEDSE